MRRLLALLMLLVMPASAQTPGTFTPGSTLSATALNAALASKADINASAATVIATGGTPARTLAARATDTIQAVDYGTCTWDATHDVGPCINAAIAVAAARGGATVAIPAGAYGLVTPIVQNTSGVHLLGAGVGKQRDNFAPSLYRAITRLVWIGVADATMATVEPASLIVPSLYSANVDGIVFDCASLAAICIKISQVNASILRFGVSEPRSIGALLTTSLTADAPGTQTNDAWISSRSTNAAYSPTGIMLDGGEGSTWNTSYNRFWLLDAWYYKGDGIVIGSTDNNMYYDVRTFPQPGATGKPVIWSAPGYTSPNGVSTSSLAGYSSRVLHMGSPGVIQGFAAASTLTAGGGNTGTIAFTPVALTTDATAAARQRVLSFPATTGVAAGMTANCGGYSLGVIPLTAVGATTSTTVSLASPTVASVASGTVCSFSYGLFKYAASGTYTITASGASTFDITAPAGGTSQTGVVIASGRLTFTDVVLPVTGAAVAGDTWSLVVGAPPFDIMIEGVDKANSVADPVFQVGATGAFTTTSNPFPTMASTGINQPFARELCAGQVPAIGTNAVNIGNCGGIGATGTGATTVNGVGNVASGFGGTTIGGHNNTASGTYSVALGEGGVASGDWGSARGNLAIDRGRIATDCSASGMFATKGDAQTCLGVLRKSGATDVAFRLTANALTAGTDNCVNIPNNTAYTLNITVTAFDHTTVSINETWPAWTGLLTRGANAASTALTMNTTPTPITNGSVGGSAIAATADTTNGCLNVSFTPPTANTDTWNVVARVETVEVQ